MKKMKEEANKRAKLEADNTALRRQMRNMATMAEERTKDNGRERNRSHNRREERGRRSPILPPRTPGKWEEGRRLEERRGRDPSNRRRRSCSRDNGRNSSQDRRIYSNMDNRRSNSSGRRQYDDRRRSYSDDRRRSIITQDDDCYFWIRGKCRYGRNCTGGAHIPEKEGVKMRPDQDFRQGRAGSPGRGRGEQVLGRRGSTRGCGSHWCLLRGVGGGGDGMGTAPLKPKLASKNP